MTNIPFQLSEGLFLHKSQKLIPWYESPSELSEIEGYAGQSCWENEIVFEDLKVSVQAMEAGNGMFFLIVTGKNKAKSVLQEYEQLLAKLTGKFGEPSEDGYDDGSPYSRWRWGSICLNITIGEHFSEYVALSVSNGVIR
jgi:hypothetical protein